MILHEQLLYPYHVQRVQGLRPADYPVRRRFCRWFLLGLDNALDNTPLNRRQELWFLHDGTPPHYSRQVRDFLRRTYPRRWIGRNGPRRWPTRSPDLNPPDFFYGDI
jgi:hypothetical protein